MWRQEADDLFREQLLTFTPPSAGRLGTGRLTLRRPVLFCGKKMVFFGSFAQGFPLFPNTSNGL